MPARTPHGIALDQLLADGAWHDRATVVDHIAPHVPPGQATRRADYTRARNRAANGNPGPPRTGMGGIAPHDPQTVGAHDIAMRLIASRIQRRAIEKTTTPDGRTLIRKTP